MRIMRARSTASTAAPCPIPVKEQMIAWWGPIVEEYYGATEGIGFTACNSAEWLAHPGTVGRAAVQFHVRRRKITDEGFAFFNQLFGIVVNLVEIVARIERFKPGGGVFAFRLGGSENGRLVKIPFAVAADLHQRRRRMPC